MSTQHHRILLVDDDLEQYTLFCAYLGNSQKETFLLDHAVTAKSCLENPQVYDLYLIDYRLPDMSGIALLEELRKRQNTTPAILVTGVKDSRIEIEAINVGFEEFLEKWDISKESFWMVCHYVIRPARKKTETPTPQDIVDALNRYIRTQIEQTKQLDLLQKSIALHHTEITDALDLRNTQYIQTKQEMLSEVGKQLEKGSTISWYLTWVKDNPKPFLMIVGTLLTISAAIVLMVNYLDKDVTNTLLSRLGK